MKKTKIILIALTCIAAGILLAGCTKPLTRGEVENKYRDRIEISYDIGDGTWGGSDRVEISHMYEKKEGGTKILEPGSSALDKAKPSLVGHFAEGWYTDSDYTHKWNFDTDKAVENLKLYVRWLPNFRYNFYYVNESGEEVEISGRDANPGETLPASVLPTREGYTFLGKLYSDPTLTTEWDYSFTHPGKVENGEQKNREVRIYSDWIEGNYVLASKPEDLSGIGANNIYLMADIDFRGEDGKQVTDWAGGTAEFNGIIKGNGFAIKNIELEFPTMNNGRAREYGLFGTIGSRAQFIDVKFENVKITVTDDAGINRSLGLFAGVIEDGATFTDTSISGTLEIKALSDYTNYDLGLIGGVVHSNLSGLNYTGVTLEADECTTHTITLESDNTITFVSKTAEN